MTTAQHKVISAGYVVIGDEILSGRTKDKNIGYLASFLTELGIDLQEVRVVPDIEERIVEAVNALRARYTHVFTSGGIGPTHDDITADAIAKAFEVGIDIDPRAFAILEQHYAQGEFTPARQRMARIPHGASLIKNSVSAAPGFKLENVHVLAGVPAIMQAMLDEIGPTLETGAKMLSGAIDIALPESRIAAQLAKVQADHPKTAIGSYPSMKDGVFSTQVVVRAREVDVLRDAIAAVEALATKALGTSTKGTEDGKSSPE
ncbi:competence/damage-inducible protein A [Polycladidibacter hongkongensis]|uniref:competence/damage-inducible protein A n=1 Tax=Polycladidibacter hongkongensis TaxID=1647556 RepID=UPI00082CE833|nr:molybdopterin-binding protein [Pseudovibrio hongkongensis]